MAITLRANELILNTAAKSHSGVRAQYRGIDNRSRVAITNHRRPAMNRSAKTIIIAALGILSITATNASAETWWEKTHPRRDQVNDRLEDQSRRINDEYREGGLTAGQAARLHAEDHAIRQEERVMSSFNHGHITPAGQRALNQQENAVSRRIGY